MNEGRLGLLGFALLGLSFIGFAVFNVMTFETVQCANTLVAAYPSPSGDQKAAVFDRDCGATTSFTTHVSLLKADEGIGDEYGNVLSVRGQALEDIGQVEWTAENAITITVLTDDLLIERKEYDIDVEVTLRRPERP